MVHFQSPYFVCRSSKWWAEGAMLGHYQSAMSIFALKNWCKWTDNANDMTDNDALGKLDSILAEIKEDAKNTVHD